MSEFLEIFNIFDVFSMLIPGIAVTYVNLSIMPEAWLKEIHLPFDAEVATFFVVSYFVGIILHEIGTWSDLLIGKIVYGGEPNKMCLREKPKWKLSVLRNQELRNTIYEVSYRFPFCVSKDKMDSDMSSHVYQYCANYLEAHKANGKADKMLVVSEMSRSLAVGCLLTLVWQIAAVCCGKLAKDPFFPHRTLLFFLLTFLFGWRKVRYEQYRYAAVFRTYLALSNKKDG